MSVRKVLVTDDETGQRAVRTTVTLPKPGELTSKEELDADRAAIEAIMRRAAPAGQIQSLRARLAALNGLPEQARAVEELDAAEQLIHTNPDCCQLHLAQAREILTNASLRLKSRRARAARVAGAQRTAEVKQLKNYPRDQAIRVAYATLLGEGKSRKQALGILAALHSLSDRHIGKIVQKRGSS